MARIPYPEHDAHVVSRLPAPLNAFRMLSHAEPLTGPAIDLGLAILSQTELPPRLRELAIMAVASWTGCDYETVQHTPIALDCGITAAQLRILATTAPGNWAEPLPGNRAEPGSNPQPGPFSPADHALLTATAEILLRRTVSPYTLDRLREHLTPRQSVETIITVGYYAMLAGLMNGLAIDIDPLGEHFIPLSNHRTVAAATGGRPGDIPA